MEIYYIYWLIYAFLGFIVETLYVSIPNGKFVERGFLHGPIIPIYAFGAMSILYFLVPFSSHPLSVFLLGIILTSTLEYLTSWAMEKLFDMRWWDYSKRKFNINGRICLRNSILFGLLSVILVEWIHPFVTNLLAKVPSDTLKFIALSSFIILVIDFTSSLLSVINFKRYVEQVDKVKNEVLTWFEEHNSPLSFDEFSNATEDFFEGLDVRFKEAQAKLKLTSEKFKTREKKLLKRFPELKSDKFNQVIIDMKNKYKNK